MTKIPNFADILANFSNQSKTLEESAADLGAIILEMEHEKKYYGKRTKKMAKLKKLAALQERVIQKMMGEIIDESDQPKRPNLKILK